MHSQCDERYVLSSLNEVLYERKFLQAPKMSEFLKYVVLETLAGNSSRIKAYNIAVDALDKPSTFDPQQDPSVRVMGKRLRDFLEDYYVRKRGHVIMFKFTRGSYVPDFAHGDAYQYVLFDQVNTPIAKVNLR